MNPGDTDPVQSRCHVGHMHSTLNEGRGMNPGDTIRNVELHLGIPSSPLNEGRGMNPGDTASRKRRFSSRHFSTKAEA